ncbi:MAG: hypothetical protein H3C47_03870 [Candidatus Cloacimonetes bacterium]|nr:hypothetical protein [Candidatus Cloacimonadota bacterium]
MKSSVTRDRILRYLYLGLQVQELLWYFGPCRELTDSVYQGKVRLQKEVERPLWQGERGDRLTAVAWQDLSLTLIPQEEVQVRDLCLSLASEQTRRAIEEEQTLIYKSIILVETDAINQVHEVVRRSHMMDHAIRLLYRGHPRFYLETLKFYLVTHQELSEELTEFLRACGISPVIIDLNSIPANFVGSRQELARLPDPKRSAGIE